MADDWHGADADDEEDTPPPLTWHTSPVYALTDDGDAAAATANAVGATVTHAHGAAADKSSADGPAVVAPPAATAIAPAGPHAVPPLTPGATSTRPPLTSAPVQPVQPVLVAPLAPAAPPPKPAALTLSSAEAVEIARQRIAAVAELVSTEQSYLAGLETLCTVFYDPITMVPPFLLLKRSTRDDVSRSAQRVISTEEQRAIFSNLSDIVAFHRRFCRVLEARIRDWNDRSKVRRRAAALQMREGR